METVKVVLLFCLGLVCLIKGGDWFVDGATAVAKKFRIPDLIIGATVVSIGTTLPEVMVSATGAISGSGSVAYGNAIGSIICNTSLILAITIAVRPAIVERAALIKPALFFFGAAAFYCVIAYAFGFFYRWTGFVLLAIFVVYILITVVPAVKAGRTQTLASETPTEASETQEEEEEKEKPFWLYLVLLVVGAALIAVGADLLVDNGIIIAGLLGVPESVIALTFMALGTSLPELVTAITSLAKGHGLLSLGNIIGANLFNLALVCGVSISISPFAVPADKTINGMNASFLIDIPLMLFVMLFICVPALIRGKLTRFQGILLLALYAAFCVFQFVS